MGIITKSKKSILGKPCTSGKLILFKNQEKSLQALHEWIEQLCDPEENFCETLRLQLERGWDAEVEQDARVSWGKDMCEIFLIRFLDIFLRRFLEMFLRRFLSGDFSQEEGVRKRVGSISLAGITGPEELELLEEEAHCESEVPILPPLHES